MFQKFSRQQAALALLLLVPAPSIGVAMAVLMVPGSIGQTLFTDIKIWLIAFPIVWTWRVEGQRVFPFDWFRRRGIKAGVILGCLMFGIIVGGLLAVGAGLD